MPTDPLKLQWPIVLVHGLGAKSRYGPIEYFHGIPGRLRQAGNLVFVADLTSWQTLEHRKRELHEQIDRNFPEGKVNLIGHSMGGLDCRLLAADPTISGRIASVTTVGTPNRGCLLADLALGILPDATLDVSQQVLEMLKLSGEGFRQITTKHMTGEFMKQAPEAEGVRYFSATSVIQGSVYRNALPMFWLTHRILQRYEGENDGFVSLHSARWGEHICTYTGDHYAQVGQIAGFSRGMDHHQFFDEIILRLKREGF